MHEQRWRGSDDPQAETTPHRWRCHTSATPAFNAPLVSKGELVRTENWHQERDRLVQLLQAIERGDVTHIDEAGSTQLQATNFENVTVLKQRLAKLNDRLGGQ